MALVVNHSGGTAAATLNAAAALVQGLQAARGEGQDRQMQLLQLLLHDPNNALQPVTPGETPSPTILDSLFGAGGQRTAAGNNVFNVAGQQFQIGPRPTVGQIMGLGTSPGATVGAPGGTTAAPLDLPWPVPQAPTALPAVMPQPVPPGAPAPAEPPPSQPGKTSTLQLSAAQQPYAAMAQRIGTETGLTPMQTAQWMAQIEQESSWDPHATGKPFPAAPGRKAGTAKGLGQLIDETAATHGVTDSYDPEQNLRGSAAYSKQLFDEFKDPRLFWAAYHAGEEAVRQAGGAIPNIPATQAHVQNVLKRLPKYVSIMASATSEAPEQRMAGPGAPSATSAPEPSVYQFRTKEGATITRNGVPISIPTTGDTRAASPEEAQTIINQLYPGQGYVPYLTLPTTPAPTAASPPAQPATQPTTGAPPPAPVATGSWDSDRLGTVTPPAPLPGSVGETQRAAMALTDRRIAANPTAAYIDVPGVGRLTPVQAREYMERMREFAGLSGTTENLRAAGTAQRAIITEIRTEERNLLADKKAAIAESPAYETQIKQARTREDLYRILDALPTPSALTQVAHNDLQLVAKRAPHNSDGTLTQAGLDQYVNAEQYYASYGVKKETLDRARQAANVGLSEKAQEQRTLAPLRTTEAMSREQQLAPLRTTEAAQKASNDLALRQAAGADMPAEQRTLLDRVLALPKWNMTYEDYLNTAQNPAKRDAIFEDMRQLGIEDSNLKSETSVVPVAQLHLWGHRDTGEQPPDGLTPPEMRQHGFVPMAQKTRDSLIGINIAQDTVERAKVLLVGGPTPDDSFVGLPKGATFPGILTTLQDKGNAPLMARMLKSGQLKGLNIAGSDIAEWARMYERLKPEMTQVFSRSGIQSGQNRSRELIKQLEDLFGETGLKGAVQQSSSEAQKLFAQLHGTLQQRKEALVPPASMTAAPARPRVGRAPQTGSPPAAAPTAQPTGLPEVDAYLAQQRQAPPQATLPTTPPVSSEGWTVIENP